MSDDDEDDSLLRAVAASPPMTPPPGSTSLPAPPPVVPPRRRMRLVLALAGGAPLVALLLAVVAAHIASSRAVTSAPTAAPVDGVLDLSAHRLPGHPVRLFSSRWSFYWDRLVSDDPRAPRPAPDASSSLRSWTGITLRDGTRPPPFGYATYQLRILLPAAVKNGATELAVRFSGCATEASLMVRDEAGALLAKGDSGTVGTRPEDSVAYDIEATLRFRTRSNLFVTMYCSNWENANSGGPREATLGTVADIDALVTTQRTLDFFIIGVLVMIGVHHLLLFALRRRDRGPLWFGLLCLLLALRALVIQRYIYEAFPSPALWAVLWRLSYLTFYIGVPLFALFFRALFPRSAKERTTRAIVAVSMVFTVIALVAPIRIVTTTLHVFQGFTIACMVWVVYLMVVALVRNRDTLAGVLLLGFIAFIACILYDMYLTDRGGLTSQASHYGIALFVVFQSVLLAIGNERARREVDRLNEQLREQITDRSHRLQEALLRAESAPHLAESAPGQVLRGRYRLDKLIGSGGMGKVFQATRIDDRQRVAIKLLKGPWKAATLARFAREAELAARIAHPHVIAVHDLDITDQGSFYIVMDLVTDSLDKHQARYGDRAWAVKILHQLADAIEAIHRAGILHRDLKPANVLLDDGSVKVADFGIAGLGDGDGMSSVRLRMLEAGDTQPAELKLTQAGALLGSPMYMAPELFGGAERATTRSDIFSFGLIAFELLTGRRPFARPIVLERAEGRMPEPPPSLTKLIAIDERVADIVDLCLHFAPGARPDAATVRAALSSVV